MVGLVASSTGTLCIALLHLVCCGCGIRSKKARDEARRKQCDVLEKTTTVSEEPAIVHQPHTMLVLMPPEEPVVMFHQPPMLALMPPEESYQF